MTKSQQIVFDPSDMEYYLQIVDRNVDQIFSKYENVVGVGVGVETVGGQRTDNICLIVEVKEKSDDIPRDQRIPKSIDGVPTDVIQCRVVEEEAASLPRPSRVESVSPLVGSLPIKGSSDVGVLGAIVFDDSTGEPLGLSARHSIGKPEPNGNKNIYHPLSGDVKKIGTLLKSDRYYDAALFKLNKSSKYTAKVVGQTRQFELGEPMRARLLSKVACLGLNYSTGTVDQFMRYRRPRGKGYYYRIYILFDEKATKTSGGDSGSIWVDIASGRPIGLHRGKSRNQVYSHIKRKYVEGTDFAVATCITELTSWHPFSFQSAYLLEPILEKYQTCFVPKKNGFLALCQTPGIADNLVIKKFGKNFKETASEYTDHRVHPKSGFTCATLSIDGVEKTFTFWVSNDNSNIMMAELSLRTGRLKNRSFRNLEFKSFQRPTAISYQGKLILAFTDATETVPQNHSFAVDTPERRIVFATTSDGENWSLRHSSTKSRYAPALTVREVKTKSKSGKIKTNSIPYIAWVNRSHQLCYAKLVQTRRSFDLSRSRSTLKDHLTYHDPAFCFGDGKLVLGYTVTNSNQLLALESQDAKTWVIRNLTAQPMHSSPSLCSIGSELVWSRFKPYSYNQRFW